MSKFKPGDQVRRIRNPAYFMPLDSVWSVDVVSEDGRRLGFKFSKDTHPTPWFSENFELVIPRNKSTRTVGDLLFSETSIQMTDPVTGGRKGQRVVRYDMIPPEAMAEIAACYGKGEEKYPTPAGERPNWERGMPYSWNVRALETHLAKWKLGHDFDEEDGVSHLAHLAWHAVALMTYQARGIGTDDRPKS